MILFLVGVPAAAFAAYAVLLYLLFRSGITPGPRRVLAFFLLADCAASFSSLALHTNLGGNPTAAMWALAFSGTFVYACLLHFALVFPYRRTATRYVVPFIYSVLPIVLVLAYITGLGIQQVDYLGDGFTQIELGPMASVVFGSYVVAGGISATLLATALARTHDHYERRRIQYVLAANIFVVVGVLMNAIPQLTPYPVDILFAVACASLLSYAILRYRLLDIATVLRERTTRAITLLATLLIYLVLMVGLAFAPQEASNVTYIAGGTIAAVLIAWLYYRFGDAIERGIRARIMNVRYDRAQVLEKTGQLLSRLHEVGELSSALVALVSEKLECSRVGLWLAERHGDNYTLSSSRGLGDSPTEDIPFDDEHPLVVRLKLRDTVIGAAEMLELRRLLGSLRVSRDAIERLDANVAVPLPGSERLLGILLLGPRKNGAYLQQDLILLDNIRRQAGVALENAYFQKRLRALASQLSQANERERRLVADGIHDQIGQPLAVIKMRLGALQKRMASTIFGHEVDEVQQLLDEMMHDTRSLTFALSPPVLYELGLEAALEWLAEQIQQGYGLTCEFADDGQAKPLDDGVRNFLFWAARELLMNAVKHARAQTIRVFISRDDHNVRLLIEDDGIGFDATDMEQRTHGLGLFYIRQRLAEFRARVEVRSQPGQGTRITLVAPLRSMVPRIAGD